MSAITEAKSALQGVLSELRKQAFQPMQDPAAAQAPQPAPAAPVGPPQADPAAQGAPPMDPAMLQAAMGAGAVPPMDPAAAPTPTGIDPSTLVQLLQAVEQISQVLQSVAAQQHSQEQKIHHIATEQAKCAGEVALLLKLLKQQPEPPAAPEIPTPNAGVVEAPQPVGAAIPAV